MALLVLVVVAGLAALFLIPGSTPRMDIRRYPNSLAVLEQVPVNGTRQWILIRTESATNPVVLFVHGGPGTSWLTLMRKNTQPLEKYFTVVNWDQRRAGKSFAAGRVDAEMTIGAFVDDLMALSSDLARRFHKNKILLVGHSWGSVIGVIAASRCPDLFSAYIGIGQMSRMAESELISYTWTLEQAERGRGQDSPGAGRGRDDLRAAHALRRPRQRRAPLCRRRASGIFHPGVHEPARDRSVRADQRADSRPVPR